MKKETKNEKIEGYALDLVLASFNSIKGIIADHLFSDFQAVREFAASIAKKHSVLDILINNAGALSSLSVSKA